MSETDADTVIQVPRMDLVRPEPDMILAKRHEFPGTAALVETLKPYYEHAIKTLESAGQVPEKKHTTTALAHDRLPEAVAKEVRTHLAELQSSAFLFEAHGAVERAREIRGVAQNLGSMLHVTQEFCKQVQPGHLRGRED